MKGDDAFQMNGSTEIWRKTSRVKNKHYCEGNGRNVPGHSKRARTCLACRAEKQYLLLAPPNGQVWHKVFLWWVRVQVPKMPSARSALPFLGRLRRRAINPTLPKEVKAWGGEAPLETEGNYSSHQATPGRIRASASTADRNDGLESGKSKPI